MSSSGSLGQTKDFEVHTILQLFALRSALKRTV